MISAFGSFQEFRGPQIDPNLLRLTKILSLGPLNSENRHIYVPTLHLQAPAGWPTSGQLGSSTSCLHLGLSRRWPLAVERSKQSVSENLQKPGLLLRSVN